MSKIEVKALEWSEVIGRDDQYYKGIFAPGYRIDWRGYGKGEGPYRLDKHGEFETLEAAKAAAQSDFDARIRSAIERKAEPVMTDADEIMRAVFGEYDADRNRTCYAPWKEVREKLAAALSSASETASRSVGGTGFVKIRIDTKPNTDFGISRSQVSRIQIGTKWAWLEDEQP